MFDSLATAVVQLDDRGCVLKMNAAAEHCLATGRDRVHGSPFQDIEGVPDALNKAISTTVHEQHGRHLHECRMAGGWYGCTIQPMPGRQTLLEFYDLNWQQQQNRMQLREVQTGMMDLLRRNLGHEIRNPLGGIRGAAQMLSLIHISEPTRQPATSRMQSSA